MTTDQLLNLLYTFLGGMAGLTAMALGSYLYDKHPPRRRARHRHNLTLHYHATARKRNI